MRKIGLFFACVLASTCAFAQSAWDGSTVSTPSIDRNNYNITKPEELAWVAQEWKTNGTDFKGKTLNIQADIDLGNHEWTPIGSPEAPFMGSLNGNKHLIKNFKITAASNDYIGLFGYIMNKDAGNLMTISNLFIRNANINGHDYVGAICGLAKNVSFVQCTVDTSTIKGNNAVGGFAGIFKNSAAIESYTKSVTITAAMYGGLFIGVNDSADRSNVTISESYAKGLLTCGNYGGGFVGHNGYKATVKNCYVIIRYTGQGSKLGLFCGLNDTLGVMENCAYNNNLHGNLTTSALFEDHNHIDQETYFLGYARNAFSTQTFYGDFVNNMNHNTDKWHFDFVQFPINEKDPIHAWQYTIFNEVPAVSEAQLSVYPNPVRNTLFIKVNGDETIQQVEVMNLLGAVIATANEVDNIDMSSYKTGIYLLRVHTNHGIVTKKIVKK